MEIKEITPLSLAEAGELVKEKDTEIKGFVKKFSNLPIKEYGKLKEELENLGIMKTKADHIVKIGDFLPEDSAEVNKIFSDVSLDEDEINKIIEVVKKYK